MTTYSAYNQHLAYQMEHLITIVQSSPILNHVFEKASALSIDHYYIGAGCITQTVWNHVLQLPLEHGINDIDFVYYDVDLSPDKECKVIDRVSGQFGAVPFKLDVKNQARVHLWYEQRFGYPITPYASLEAAINSWPTTATAIGMRKNSRGDWAVYAPFGLNDLFGLIVRANKTQIKEEIYDKKVQRWTQQWPGLNVIPW